MNQHQLPLETPIAWKSIPLPCPHNVIAGFAVNPAGEFIMMHRSDKVRSAKNVWSIPSGLHEIGKTMADHFAVELLEELNLRADPNRGVMMPAYENIGAHEDPYHWVINMMVIPVETFATLENTEPDKHDQIVVVSYADLIQPDFLKRFPVHPSALPWWKTYAYDVHHIIAEMNGLQATFRKNADVFSH